MDQLKDADILVPAYDDSSGVTAEFNKNILRRINRELDADFDPDLFQHKAVFNAERSRMEMHLMSLAPQTVTIGQLQQKITFRKDEAIHTENSYKFSKERIEELAALSGFQVKRSWYDAQDWFSVNLFKPV